MLQYFICNPTEIENKLKTFIKTQTTDGGWTHYYKDEKTNEEWQLYRYHSEYQGGGVPVLKRLPEPGLEELIDIAMISNTTGDIIGASLELSEREKNKIEYFRGKLLDRLLMVDLTRMSAFERERFKLIINESELSDPVNRRDIIGKSLSEIQDDAHYFQVISEKAKQILNDIK
jgi:Immunity protein 27